MQNRLYTVIDKSLFPDPDNILVGVFEFMEISGSEANKTFDKLKVFYPHAHFDDVYGENSGLKSATVYRRAKRGDRDTNELKSILALLKKGELEVKGGRKYYFCEGVGQNQIDAFLKENVNAYVYICDVADSPSEAALAKENPIIENFCMATYTELVRMRKRFDIKMAIDDLMCVQNYFISESREPSFVEIKIIDNFFSENFRHTTFETILDSVDTDDEAVAQAWEHYRNLRKKKTPSLSDITKAAKAHITKDNVFKAGEKLSGVKLPGQEGEDELLLIVKNESHNRSTTAVAYDGAAGCIGGAVKDLLCALAYPYDSYRVSGTGKNDKCRKNAIISSAGYADTAAGIGVSCSKCKEDVSNTYNEKQREVCAVLALAKKRNTDMLLEKIPQAGDKIYLIGSKTGADGSHCLHTNLVNESSVGEYISVTSTAELSALKRLFTSQEFADIAVAVNDIGSGGVVCALGEITDGADIDISNIATKYEISVSDAVLSESGERMIVCVRAEGGARLESLCKKAGLLCMCIGNVTADKRFVIYDGAENRIASLTSTFLLSGGAEKHLSATVKAEDDFDISEALIAAKAPLESVSTIKKIFGRGKKYDFEKACLISAEDTEVTKTELMNRYDRTASGYIQSLENPSVCSDISLCRLSYNGSVVSDKDGNVLYSALACGAANSICERMPFSGAYLSLVEAVLKLVCAGCGENEIYLSLQEYFPEHKNNSTRLGVSVASMLGCFEAQMQLGIPSIGGRISIGGGESEKENISSVNAFAFCLCEGGDAIGKALTKAGSKIILVNAERAKSKLPDGESIAELISTVNALKNSGALLSAAVVNAKNPATVLMEMCKVGKKGVVFSTDCDIDNIFGDAYASVICELDANSEIPKGSILLGSTCDEYKLMREDSCFDLAAVFGTREHAEKKADFKRYMYTGKSDDGYGTVKPLDDSKVRVLMPLTDGSVMQDNIKACFEAKEASVKVLPVNENNISELVKQIKKADIVWLSNALGCNAFLSAVLADKRVISELAALRERGGLIYGQGNAFESLVINGILDIDTEKFSFSNTPFTGERVKICTASQYSPFARSAEVGKEYTGYVRGNRIKLNCESEYADELAKDGRIITRYTADTNPLCSGSGIDSVCSSDGRVLGQISIVFGDKAAYPVVDGAMGYFLKYSR